MSQADSAAIEVNDVASAANEIERRMTEAENTESTEEVINEEQSEEAQADAEIQDESTETPNESDETQDGEESEQELETEEPNEDQEETFETLSDFAEAIDTPIEDFMANIKTTVKINGEEQEVSLSDLKNGYQMESDYRQKTTAHAEKVRAFEQEAEQANLNIQNKLQEVELLSTNLENQLLEEFNSVNWTQLEQEDKEEFVYQQQKFGLKKQQIDQMKAQTQENLREYAQVQELKNQEAMQVHLAKEHEAMMTAIPEWSDPSVMEADHKGMSSFLSEYGFSNDDINNIQDHRLMRLARDAYKRQGMSEKVDIAKKKVKTLPKIVKSGKKTNKQDVAIKDQKSKLNKYKKTGSTQDLAAALLDRM